MPEVAFVCKTLPHYRVDFFTQLRELLRAEGVHLRVIVGQPNALASARNDTGSLPWAETVTNRYLHLGRRRTLVWQPCVRLVRPADLVIVEQASKLLLNFLLLAWRPVGGPAVAWWGHGINLDQTGASRSGEAVKRLLARRATWWFAYTEGTRRIVEGLGVPPGIITVTQNAIDTTTIALLRERITASDALRVRTDLGLGPGPIGLFLASLYPAKRLQFALTAAERIRETVPDFQLIVVGDGPDRPIVDDACRRLPWIRATGSATGPELVHIAAACEVMINPGVVGLNVLDAFALQLPMVTTSIPGHGPEIEYLEAGRNGIVLAAASTPAHYGDEVAALLRSHTRLESLRSGCRAATEELTLAAMTERFADGIQAALAGPARRRRRG